MKVIKYTAVAAVLSFSLTACGNAGNKTLGGTKDTSNVSAGSNAGNGSNSSSLTDTAKQSGTDSTSHGNANPTGHRENDTINKNKMQQRP